MPQHRTTFVDSQRSAMPWIVTNKCQMWMVGSRGSWGIQRKAEKLKMYVLSVVRWESRTEGPDV